MAGVSASDLSKLDTLLAKGDSIWWEIADYLIHLIDVKGAKLLDIAARYKVDGVAPVGRSYSRLSEYYNNGKAFPPGVRRLDLFFEQHQIVRTSANRVEKSAAEAGEDIKIDRKKYLDMIGSTMQTGRQLSRQVSSIMAKDTGVAIQKRRKDKAGDTIKSLPPEKTWWVDSMNLGDYIDTLSRMDDESIQMIEMDAPYGQFTKTPNGKYDTSASAATVTDCANETEPEAVKTVVDGIPIAAKKIQKHGVILLWQAGRYLRPRIAQAIEDAGLEVRIKWVWNKSPNPGDNRSPFSLSCEDCYVICRKDAKLVNLAINHKEYSSRKQVWDFSKVHHNAAQVDFEKGTHMFEKPHQTNELNLFKFTSENDTVFICFGGSGSMVEDCIKHNRRYVYCEMKQKCYDLAEARINRLKKLNTPEVKPETKVNTNVPIDALLDSQIAEKVMDYTYLTNDELNRCSRDQLINLWARAKIFTRESTSIIKHESEPIMDDVKKKAITFMVKHGVQAGWKFEWCKSKKHLGICIHMAKVISLNELVARHGSKEMVDDTILHEIAHALAGPEAGHKKAWKDKCKAIGATPSRLACDKQSREFQQIINKHWK